jgi:hypothetical protein
MARSRSIESVPAADQGQASPSEPERDRIDPDMVARRAYQRFEERGRQDGADQEDWFAAERELREEAERGRRP